jgi:FAD/FMN-containing dehydrogenase
MRRRSFLQSALAGFALLGLPPAALRAAPPPGPRRRLPPRFEDVPAITGDGRSIVLPRSDIEELARALRGRLLLGGDDGYDDARRVLNPDFDRHPALVVQATGPTDVRLAVDFARDHGGVLLAVKCGGHSPSGQSTCDLGMVLDLSGYRAVRVDPERRRAWVSGGSLLGAVDHECLAHGLAVPLGTVSHTGVGGLVTGGGFGRLGRRFGLSVDNLASVQVVTADGVLRHADAQENPDLFWGVRGGGGNFGVVTGFEFELHPFERRVVAGERIWPADRARELLELWGEIAPELPDTVQLDPFIVYPPGGEPGIAGFGICHSGPESQVERDLAPLERLGPSMVDSVASADYQDVQRSGDIADPRAMGQYLKGGFVNALTPELARVAAEGLEPHPARATVLFAQQGGGAISRVSTTATAFSQREVLGNLLCITSYPHGTDGSSHMAWARSYWTSIEPFTYGFYVNDLEPTHTQAQVQANYRENLARLVRVKDRYDPGNLFRLNANIQPSGG